MKRFFLTVFGLISITYLGFFFNGQSNPFDIIIKSGAFTFKHMHTHPHEYAFNLEDGKFLLIGEVIKTRESTAQLYDIKLNQFSDANAPQFSRAHNPVGTTLLNGNPLIAGGPPNSGNNHIIEMYDRQTHKWSKVGELPEKSRLSDALTLLDGRVLYTNKNGHKKGVLIWDPKSNTTLEAGHPSFVVNGSPLANLLPNGNVLITHLTYAQKANKVSSAAFFFDPKTNQTTIAPKLNQERSSHQATSLNNGDILITGGLSEVNLAKEGLNRNDVSAELFDVSENKFIKLKPILENRSLHRQVLLSDGRVMIIGGVKTVLYTPFDYGKPIIKGKEQIDDYLKKSEEHRKKHPTIFGKLDPYIEIFNPSTGDFTPVTEPPFKPLLRHGPKGGLGHPTVDGKTLFLTLSGAMTFDPKTETWHLTP